MTGNQPDRSSTIADPLDGNPYDLMPGEDY